MISPPPADAAFLQAAFLPDPFLPAQGRIVLYDLSGAPPDAGALDRLGVDAGKEDAVPLVLPSADGPPAAADVPVLVVELADALPALLRIDAGDAVEVSDALRAWARAAAEGLELVASGRLLPTLSRAGGDVVGTWRIAGRDPAVGASVQRIGAALPLAACAVPVPGAGTPRVWRPDPLVRAFFDAIADLAVRRGGPPPRAGRPRARLLPWTARWAEALIDPADPVVPLRDDADELVAGVTAWAGGATAAAPTGRAEFALRTPPDADGPWRLVLGVRTDGGDRVDAAEVWSRGSPTATPSALQQTLLRGLSRATRVFPPLDDALDDAAPEGVDLDVEQAWAFLQAAERLLSEGVGVLLPPELATSELALRVRLEADAEADPAIDPAIDPDPGAARGGAAAADEDDLPGREPDRHRAGPFTGGLFASFRWEVALGGDTLSEEEFAALVASKAPLIRVRDRWVRVDPGRVDRLSRLGPPGRIPLADAFALGLAGSESAASELFGNRDGADEDAGEAETIEVVVHGGLADLIDRIHEAGDRPPVPSVPPGFSGELRPYQRRGVAWLAAMGELGLGAVLADQMGLGKTIQLTAYLLTLPPGSGPHLVVCPTSVVGNWQRELQRFAPSVPVTRHHGPQRPERLDGVEGIVLTSYGTLRRDVDLLSSVPWDIVALDEAQQIKNPTTAAARAVRRLRARQTVALTGTPLENRLGELWALFDATNPGLLGSRARFGRRFVTPIEQRRDLEAARRLRRLVAPFVLRREKREVATDLPAKDERTVVCALTPEQAALYQSAVDRVLGGGLGKASGIERRGRILALLTELKQICNHPAQYLRERERRGHPVLAGRSGKLAVARELVVEAVDEGAQLLVFTQYVAMGHLLVEQFAADLATPVPFLHGGVPAGQRDRMVAAFQGEQDALEELRADRPPPVLVVSLRAGGTGLNLTAATHVVHYDRWWNPAVEDQATDRAHRIGQTSPVTVHKLVTAGTLEERVAQLLEQKRRLAEEIVGTGEAWLTELGDAELAELVALAVDAPVDTFEDETEGAA